jgi:hypothetical protein
VATDDITILAEAARRAITAIYRKGYDFQKTAVMFSCIVPKGAAPQSLFDINLVDDTRMQSLM